MSKKLPISLIIDDGGVINTYFFHDLRNNHEFLVPPAFALQFGKLCAEYGVKGKFSVIPIPCGLGRLDEKDKVNMVPAGNVEAFIDYAKRYIAPRFSIAPELLTHLLAWNLNGGGKTQYCEDVFIERLDAEGIAEYLSLGMQILDNIGLTPTGISSPWQTGSSNPEVYARGIGMAFKRTFNADKCFYFRYTAGEYQLPHAELDSPETGKVCFVPSCTPDPFWGTQNPVTVEQAHCNARSKVDSLLSEDGKSGMLRELYEADKPLIIFTHWQSLFSDGRAVGMQYFEVLLQRIAKVFGDNVEWVDFDELTRIYS